MAAPPPSRGLAAATATVAVADPAKQSELAQKYQSPQGPVTVRVRPSRPWAQRYVTVLLDFPSEPLLVPGSELSIWVYRTPGEEPLAQVVLQPLSRKGLFGAHFTPEQAGAFRMEVRERLEPSRRSKVLFEVPLSIEATQPPEEDLARSTARSDPREKLGLDQVMENLGDQWDELSLMLKDPRARKEDALAFAQGIVDLVVNVEGQVPRAQVQNRREFDAFARQLVARVGKLPVLILDRPKARAEMEDVENTLCLKCHTKFRFNLTEDVRDWPRFVPREPKTPQEPKR
jgi:hypothetical protein